MSDYTRGKLVQAGGWFACAGMFAAVAMSGPPEPVGWVVYGLGLAVGLGAELVGWRIIRRGKRGKNG